MTHPGLAVMLVVGVGLGAVLYYFFASTPEQQISNTRRQRDNGRADNLNYWSSIHNDTRNRRQDQKKCIICLEENKEAEAVRLIPCEHVFHKRCIEDWRALGAGDQRNCCPICRKPIADMINV